MVRSTNENLLERSDVPCDGCTACCRNDLIFLHPEYSDEPARYLTQQVVNPITGQIGRALQRKPNGDCIYLGTTGCTIHANAPVICREFDCRMQYAALSRHQRRELIKNGLFGKETMEAGRKRFRTLTDVQIAEAQRIGESSVVNALIGR